MPFLCLRPLGAAHAPEMASYDVASNGQVRHLALPGPPPLLRLLRLGPRSRDAPPDGLDDLRLARLPAPQDLCPAPFDAQPHRHHSHRYQGLPRHRRAPARPHHCARLVYVAHGDFATGRDLAQPARLRVDPDRYRAWYDAAAHLRQLDPALDQTRRVLTCARNV